MDVRHLRTEEIPEYQKLARYAFDSGRNNYEEMTYPSLEASPDWLYGAFDGSTLLAAATVWPYVQVVRGKALKMGGVAGVATRPEQRNRGAVRALMDRMVRDMRERGQTISSLFPFKFSYWEKFGYRLADENVLYQCDVSMIRRRDVMGRVIEETDGIIEEMKTVYYQMTRRYSLMVERGEREWKDRITRPGFSFLCRNAQGEPTGYMVLEFMKSQPSSSSSLIHEPEATIIVSELFWLDPETRQALFNVLWNHRDQRKYVAFVQPTSENIIDILDNPRILTRTVRPNSMIRLIDVDSVLRSMASENSEGSLTIAVHDDLCPWNDRVFRMDCASNGIEISKPLGTSANMDIEIGPFSQLVAGFRCIDDLCDAGHVTIDNQTLRFLRTLFPRQVNFLRDFF